MISQPPKSQTPTSHLLPWPHDAVMIVAETPDKAKREQMESAHYDRCRHCLQPVLYDGYTMRRALEHGSNDNRPVRFFCADCFHRYDFKMVTVFEDHRFKK